jgi:hypothetical protein
LKRRDFTSGRYWLDNIEPQGHAKSRDGTATKKRAAETAGVNPAYSNFMHPLQSDYAAGTLLQSQAGAASLLSVGVGGAGNEADDASNDECFGESTDNARFEGPLFKVPKPLTKRICWWVLIDSLTPVYIVMNADIIKILLSMTQSTNKNVSQLYYTSLKILKCVILGNVTASDNLLYHCKSKPQNIQAEDFKNKLVSI